MKKHQFSLELRGAEFHGQRACRCTLWLCYQPLKRVAPTKLDGHGMDESLPVLRSFLFPCIFELRQDGGEEQTNRTSLPQYSVLG